ncbi:hypothetical protein S40293_03434 [Stachybotrys chartarum IBT 40293]|nr:hypothetical protein S40293_03434 [Stachybotrys chartarum IBT 40293]
MWLFRRRGGRKRSHSGATSSDVEGQLPARSATEGDVTRTASIKKQRTDANSQNRARTYSFSPGRHDSLKIDKTQNTPAPRNRDRRSNTITAGEPTSQRQPTLHHSDRNKRQSMMRKSSKRRREELDREAEIKAMTNFTPLRPATDAWTAGRPMKKDSKRLKETPFRRQWDNPASDVSLPLPDSIHSTMSSDSDFGSYKISALDSLAPRPTLRYAHDHQGPSLRASAPTRTGSQKRTLAERVQLPQEKLSARKRIDELADDFDASDLRELLERDQRRRERKQQREQEKVERRLARRAEKQRADEAEARKTGTPPPANMERGVVGREVVGLGIEPASAVITSSKQRDHEEKIPQFNSGLVKKPSDRFHPIQSSPEKNDHHEGDVSLAGEENVPVAQPKVEGVSLKHGELKESPHLAPALATTSALSELLRAQAQKSRSKSTLASEKEKTASPPPSRIDEEDVAEKTPEMGNVARRFSLASFWRWTARNRRTSQTASFSNTSREEMQAAASSQPHLQSQSFTQIPLQTQAQVQAQARALAKLQGEELSPFGDVLAGNYMARKSSSSMPKRTRSRFREDLPDFPLSPPDSRVQSPEAEPPLPALAEYRSATAEPVPIPAPRFSTPNSGYRSTERLRQTPTSMDRACDIPSPEPHQSISLASIDSEGSWLSGRVASRRTSLMRENIARARRREAEHSTDSPTDSTEDLGIADDDYLSRLTPRRPSGFATVGRPSGEGRPSSDDEHYENDGDARWGAVGARPGVVNAHKHDRDTMRSREAQLSADYEAGGDDDASHSPTSPTSPAEDKANVQRATSVQLGKGHVRSFSAGSARLLEITPRNSVDSTTANRGKRRSVPFDL